MFSLRNEGSRKEKSSRSEAQHSTNTASFFFSYLAHPVLLPRGAALAELGQQVGAVGGRHVGGGG